MNIANRITIWVLTASLIVLIPTSWFSYRATWRVLKKQRDLIQPLFTSNFETHIVDEYDAVETVARLAAFEIEREHARSLRDFTELFTRCLNEKESIFGMIVAFAPTASSPAPENPRRGAWYLHRDPEAPDGPPVLVDLLADGRQPPVFERDWYAVPSATRKPFWSKPYRGRSTGVPMITYSIPLSDAEGRFLGVVACDVSLQWLDTFLGRIHPARGEIEEVFLLAADGGVLADKSWGFLYQNVLDVARSRGDKNLEDVVRRMLAGEQGEADYRSPDGGVEGKILFMPIDDFDGDDSDGWSLGVFVPRKALRDYAFQVGRTQALIGLAGMALLLVAFRMVARGISQPIQQLHDAALTIASGNLDATVPTMKHRDEIATLAGSFRQMQGKLKAHIASLAEATRVREQMDSELRIARRIQMSLVPKHLPETPHRDGFDLAAFIEPARQVGGDFYDYFLLDDETLGLVIADVSGKGVPAALLMARSSALFRSFLIDERRLGPALERVGREIARDNDDCMFVTLFALSVHLPSGRCRFVNAGHNPPFLVRKGERPVMLDFAASLPVGIDESGVYPEGSFRLDDGDMIFLYTDGVTEAIDAESALFGDTRTAEALDAGDDVGCDEILARVRRSIEDFTRGTPQSDDITMLALRRLVPARSV